MAKDSLDFSLSIFANPICINFEKFKDDGSVPYNICYTCQTYEHRIGKRCVRCYPCDACGANGSKNRINPNTRTHYGVTKNNDNTFNLYPERCRIPEKK
jgi:hypothetical protein